MENKSVLIFATIFLILIEAFMICKYNIMGFDKKIIYFAIFGQIMVFVAFKFENKYLLEFAHFIFQITIIAVVVFSKNIFMNYLALFALIITIITRRLLNGCLFLTSSDECVYIFPDDLDGDIIYQSTILIILLKCLYYFW